MVHSIAHVVASAVGFSGLHLFLRHGPCYDRLEDLYSRRKKRGLLAPRAEPQTLAPQAEFRILNEIHNLITVPLAVLLMFDRSLNGDTVHGCSTLARTTTQLSAGYFIVDGAVVVRHFREHGPEPLAHALICGAFFVYCAARSHLLYYIPRFLFFELSTPFVHLRWFLHSLNLHKTKLYKINGVAMLGSFFACRIVLGTKLIWKFLPAMRRYRRLPPAVENPLGPVATNAIRVLCCGATCLNYFWFYKMLRGCFKVFVSKQEA